MASSGPGDPVEAESLRLAVRSFLRGAVAAGVFTPMCDSWLHGHSPEFSRELGSRGWIGLNWPSRYGGRDRPETERYVITEEVLAAGAPVAAHWVAHRQSAPLLLRLGTESQRQRFLPAIARGECFFSIAMSEPNSGSDLASVRTTGHRVPGGWRLNGRKVWTSHAHLNHFAIILCRTEPRGEDRHAGLSQFILDLRASGLSVRPIRLLNGAPHFTEVVLDDVFIPDEMVVGTIGQGWAQVLSELGFERSGPERFLSMMPLLLAYVDGLGTPDDESAATLGLLTSELRTLRQMSISVTSALERGERVEIAAALVKDVGTRFEQSSVEVIRRALGQEADPSATECVALLLAQAVAASPLTTLRGGTTEILRGIVARELVGR